MAMKDYLCQYNFSIVIKILKMARMEAKGKGVLKIRKINAPIVVEGARFLAVQKGKMVLGG